MTSEEVDQTLQRLAVAIERLTQMVAHADERQDVSDERLTALINSQEGYESRQERIEDGFRQIAAGHQTLIQLINIHKDRLDASDESQAHTDGRLDALLDMQIYFSEGLADLAVAQSESRIEAKERWARLDEKIAQLAEAQARADEQIRLLLDRNGATEPKREASKKVGKKIGPKK